MTQAYHLTTKVPPERTIRDIVECFDKWPDAEFVTARNLKDGWNTAEVVFNFRDQPIRVRYAGQYNYRDNIRAIFLTLDDLRMSFKRGLDGILGDTVSQLLQLPGAAVKRDPYEVLGIRPDSDVDVAEAAYKALAKKRHPDAGGTAEDMTELNDAIERIRKDQGR